MIQVADFDAVKVGDPLPPLEVTFSSVVLFAYAAATWDWARMHYDTDYARSLNFPDALVDGQHYGAIFAKWLTDWLGPKAFVSRMKFNFRTPTFRDETVFGEGAVTDLARSDGLVAVTVSQILKKRGERADLVSTCTSVVHIRG